MEMFISTRKRPESPELPDGGGFLHIDDNYGMDPYVRPQMKKVFPELDFVELPFQLSHLSPEIRFPERIAQDP